MRRELPRRAAKSPALSRRAARGRLYCRTLTPAGGSDGETLAALGATRIDDRATAAGFHAGAEPVGAGALEVARLIGAFGGHESAPGLGKRARMIVAAPPPRQAATLAWVCRARVDCTVRGGPITSRGNRIIKNEKP